MTNRNSTPRTAFLVLGSLAAVAGLGFGIGGGALVWAHNTQRDSAGYYSTSAERLETSTFAMKSDQIDLGVDAADYRWVPGDGPTAVRLRATSDGSQPLFVGVARSADVDRYLAGTAHGEVVDFEVDPFRADIRDSGGSARPALPTDQTFWAASATGTGTQSVNWDVQPGTWTVVVMNADASPGVAVDVAVGAKTGVLLPIGIGMSVFALLALAGGGVLLFSGRTGGQARPRVYPNRTVPNAPVAPTATPAATS